jgi:hypothetical protein
MSEIGEIAAEVAIAKKLVVLYGTDLPANALRAAAAETTASCRSGGHNAAGAAALGS